MNDITFQKGQGGLSRPLPGEDHISGLVFYGTKPVAWGANAVRQITSPDNANTLGIVQNSVNYGVMYYQISEFFRINPGATLFVGIFTPPVAPAVYDYMEVKTMQQFALGAIRQAGLFLTTAFDTAQLTLMQAVSDSLDAIHMPLEILMTADFHAVADLTTLTSVRTLTAPKVTPILGQDGAAAGAALAVSTGKSCACLGAALGAVSYAKVHECIGWVRKFNMAAVELDVPAMANGQLLSALDPNLIDSLNTKGYVFLRKHVGISGSYFNDSHTAVVITSDYAYIESNRTMDKAIRGVRTYVLPQLNGPVKVDPDSGKLDHGTVKYIEDMANQPLVQMTRDGELSGFSAVIDPDQDVLSTSQLVIQIVNVPLGVSRNIIVKIGFGKSV
jgi:hypothetical protein